jgi:hypothetical protein
MTKNHPTVIDIMARTEQAQRELAAKFIEEQKMELRKAASKAQTFLVVKRFYGYTAFGRLSFDGCPEHLRGVDRIVWDWLEEEGLNPSFYYTTGNSGFFGGEEVGQATTYYMLADWSGHVEKGEPTLFAQELRALRDAGVVHVAAEEIEKIKVAIDTAVAEGRDWTTVHYFYGLTYPVHILPFDGSKEGLTGVPRMIWAYLDKNGLSPRLYAVAAPSIYIPGIGEVNYAERGRGYRIAARWFDKAESDGATSVKGKAPCLADPQSPIVKPTPEENGSKRKRS